MLLKCVDRCALCKPKQSFWSRTSRLASVVTQKSWPITLQHTCVSIEAGSSVDSRAASSAVKLRGKLRASGRAAALQQLPHLGDDIGSEPTELLQCLEDTEKVLIGVDPDNSGAAAIVKMPAVGGSVQSALQRTQVLVHDMPCTLVSVGKRQRKQANAAEIVKIVMEACNIADDKRVHCILEEPVPGPANGRQSVFGSGFAFGVWNGVLMSFDAAVTTVSARRWKNDLGLNGCGKEGSRALAAGLFPMAHMQLQRKKDHGRAESMLLLAWALGVRLPKNSPTAALLAQTDHSNGDSSSIDGQPDTQKVDIESHIIPSTGLLTHSEVLITEAG